MSITADQISTFQSYNRYANLRCPYEGSPLKIYKDMSSKRKGAAFEAIFEEWMKNMGYEMKKNYSSDHDRVFAINGKEIKFEIKGSTLWGEDGTSMKWQQIRVDQDYDYVCFMAILPEGIEFYFADKATIAKFVDVQDDKGRWIYNQHGGNRVRSGTFAIQGLIKDFQFMKSFNEVF